jgi:hypothetical protein
MKATFGSLVAVGLWLSLMLAGPASAQTVDQSQVSPAHVSESELQSNPTVDAVQRFADELPKNREVRTPEPMALLSGEAYPVRLLHFDSSAG